jgi:hypothetical protein
VGFGVATSCLIPEELVSSIISTFIRYGFYYDVVVSIAIRCMSRAEIYAVCARSRPPDWTSAMPALASPETIPLFALVMSMPATLSDKIIGASLPYDCASAGEASSYSPYTLELFSCT